MDAVIRIAGDGSATFPLIGSVKIGGKTVGEAVQFLQAEYRNGYLVDPQVAVTIREYATSLFTILGQVKSPGSYKMTGNDDVTLLQAIGMAGGYTRIADPGNITVKRRVNGIETVLRFNAKKMARSNTDSSFSVRPNDVITVGESIF